MSETPAWLKWLLLCGLTLGVAGYWGPWVHHRSVALLLTGPDLGEFVKFLPPVRAGQVLAFRQIFYLPPFAAAFTLAALAGSRLISRRLLPNALLLASVLPLSLALLPPVFTPSSLLSAEFRLQLLACVFCLLFAFGPGVLGLFSRRALLGTALAFCLGAASLPLWQFLSLREPIQAAYGGPIALGWGLWATPAGFLLAASCTALALARPLFTKR